MKALSKELIEGRDKLVSLIESKSGEINKLVKEKQVNIVSKL